MATSNRHRIYTPLTDATDEAEELEEPRRPSRLRLLNPETVRRHLVAVYDDVRCGRLSSLEGNRRAKLLHQINSVNEAISLEKRLAKLEAVEEARRRSTRR
jgi:hypothetical protein